MGADERGFFQPDAVVAHQIGNGARWIDPVVRAVGNSCLRDDDFDPVLADYVAVTKYYLANIEQAKRGLHKAGFVCTPLPVYLKTSDWRCDPNARVDVESLKKLSAFMLDKLQWPDKPVNVDSMVDQSFLPR